MAVATHLTADHVSPREEAAIALVVVRLRERFPALPEEVVETTVLVEHDRFADSRIRDFVPIFVERNARRDLLARS